MSVYSVAADQSRLDATFARINGVTDPQLQADFARYLCVLVSGFLEQAIRQIYGAYATKTSHSRVARYVERQLSGFTNANAEKICTLAGAFDPVWRQELEAFLGGERKDAIDSIIANRHQIVHGRDVTVTYVRIAEWYPQVKAVVGFIQGQCT